MIRTHRAQLCVGDVPNRPHRLGYDWECWQTNGIISVSLEVVPDRPPNADDHASEQTHARDEDRSQGSPGQGHVHCAAIRHPLSAVNDRKDSDTRLATVGRVTVTTLSTSRVEEALEALVQHSGL